MSELMSELGFNPRAANSAKEAFLKHLIKTSTGIVYQTPSEKKEVGLFTQAPYSAGEQLCFDLDNAGENPRQKSA